jgi:hypothetical protein
MLCGSPNHGDSTASAAGENADEAVLRCECPSRAVPMRTGMSRFTSPAALSASSTPHRRYPVLDCFGVTALLQAVVPDLCSQGLFPTCSQTKRLCGSFRHHCPHVISSRRCLSDTLKSVNSHIDSRSLKLSFLLLWPRHSLDPQPYNFPRILLYTGAGSFPRWLRRVFCFHTLF